MTPIVVEGRKIAASFWGKTWCDNLESYQDYANRLPRGRSYVRNGAVIDLRSWSARGPSEGDRVGDLFDPDHDQTFARRSLDIHLRRLRGPRRLPGPELLQGKLSKPVMDRVCRQADGLFPKPGDIKLSCSCPDSASMCKHVAAALYGAGARLDAEPELLFRLRAVDAREIFANLDAALPASRSGGSGTRLDADDLSDIFGIDMAASAPSLKPKTKASPAAAAKSSSPARISRSKSTAVPRRRSRPDPSRPAKPKETRAVAAKPGRTARKRAAPQPPGLAQSAFGRERPPQKRSDDLRALCSIVQRDHCSRGCRHLEREPMPIDQTVSGEG